MGAARFSSPIFEVRFSAAPFGVEQDKELKMKLLRVSKPYLSVLNNHLWVVKYREKTRGKTEQIRTFATFEEAQLFTKS